MKKRLMDQFRELSNINAGSGHEYYIIPTLVENIKSYADSVTIDNNGNIIALKKGRKEGPSFMIAAHSDEIGLVVKNILPNGFILFEKIGGIPDNLMQARKVYVGKNHIPGVIGVKPGHLQTAEEALKVKPASSCYIDLGLSSREEVEFHGVYVGDQIIWQSDFMQLTNPDLVATKAVDDRMGCAVIIELFKEISEMDFAGTIYGVFTVKEEVGLYGARMVGHAIQPDYAVVVDTIPAGDTPDVSTEKELPIYLGKGPGLPLADGVGHSFFSFIHPQVKKIIETSAQKLGINLQRITLLGSTYTTDAASLSYAGKGVPTATLAIPRRYSHSPIELVNINDAIDVIHILKEMINNNVNAKLDYIE